MTEPTLVQREGDCPVCAGAIDERERVVCPRCETPHHRDCYGYNQGCAIFGCNPDRPSTPLPKKLLEPLPQRPGLGSLPWAVRVALFSTAGLATFLLMTRLHLASRPVETPVVKQPAYAWQSGCIKKPSGEAPVGIEVGMKAPDFELKGLDGYDHSLWSHSRGHVSVLTFWLQACNDCLDSFPQGVALSKKFKDSGVWFTDVAYMGAQESTGKWVSDSGIVNPVLLDSSGEVVRSYGVGTYTCFVLDPEGVIRYRGPVSGAANAVAQLLEEL